MIAPGISVLTRKLFCPTKLRKALDTRGHTWPSTLTTRMPAAAVTMQAVKPLESFQFWKVVLHKTHQNQTPSWLCSVLHWAGMQIIRYHFVVIKDMPLFVHWAQLDRCFTECRMHQVALHSVSLCGLSNSKGDVSVTLLLSTIAQGKSTLKIKNRDNTQEKISCCLEQKPSLILKKSVYNFYQNSCLRFFIKTKIYIYISRK